MSPLERTCRGIGIIRGHGIMSTAICNFLNNFSAITYFLRSSYDHFLGDSAPSPLHATGLAGAARRRDEAVAVAATPSSSSSSHRST